MLMNGIAVLHLVTRFFVTGTCEHMQGLGTESLACFSLISLWEVASA